MPQKPTAYYRPQILTDALRLLEEPDARPLGGGVHLLGGDAPYPVVDLQLLGLGQIKPADGSLYLGATATLSALVDFLGAEVKTDTPAALLKTAVAYAGPNTYRNAATIGGVIARRLPDSELLAALLLLDAVLTLHTPEETTVSLVDYLQANERPPGLITAVRLAWTGGKSSSHRVARTPKDTPIVSVSGWLPDEGAARLAATGVAERPLRLANAEAALADGVTADSVETAVAAAKAAGLHPGDFRGSAAYRADMAAVLTRRVLQDLSA